MMGGRRLALVSMVAVCTSCVTGVARDINGEEDRMRMGNEAFEAQDYARAKEHYLVAVDEAPMNTQALFRLGNISLYDNDPGAAEGYYERVLALDPQFARAHYNLAVIHLGKAEDHFNYYAATLESGRAIDQPLVRLLADIEVFASPKEDSPAAKSSDPLDSLGELLGSGSPAP